MSKSPTILPANVLKGMSSANSMLNCCGAAALLLTPCWQENRFKDKRYRRIKQKRIYKSLDGILCVHKKRLQFPKSTITNKVNIIELKRGIFTAFVLVQIKNTEDEEVKDYKWIKTLFYQKASWELYHSLLLALVM